MGLRQDSNATVLMSGGIDSAACAHFLTKQGSNIQHMRRQPESAARSFSGQQMPSGLSSKG
jgi:tRNA U34 2-thiouridine synthase MnmA/TrmU